MAGWDVEVCTTLQRKHPFPFDGDYVFREKTHSYGIKTPEGYVTDLKSVTSLYPKPKEDMSRIAGFVAKKLKRTLVEYTQKLETEPPRKRTFKERHTLLDGSLDSFSVDYYTDHEWTQLELERVMPAELDGPQVQQKWREWCSAGTQLHSYMEHTLNEMDVTCTLSELDLEQVTRFLREFKGPDKEWIRTELRVGSLKHRVCGTMDALARVNGKYVIYDWKRSRNVMNPETGQKGRDYPKYQFQLTAYKKLLEINGVETDDTGYLVVFHPIYETYQLIPVDLLEVRSQVDEAFEANCVNSSVESQNGDA
jgi:hypothetical protein